MPFLLRSDEMVLLAIWQLRDQAYGVSIRRYLMEVTGEHFSFAAIYGPLDRLTQKGYVQAIDGAPTNKRGGRRRRFFKVTARGMAALSEAQAVQQRLWTGFPQLAAE